MPIFYAFTDAVNFPQDWRPTGDIEHLITSISKDGLQSPLTVTFREGDAHYQVVEGAGCKRLLAARLLGLDVVPCRLGS